MAITVTGTGVIDDPYICYSWEDFESLGTIFNIDHKETNVVTNPQTPPTEGSPQLQPNIYIKFADLKDPDDPNSEGVDIQEVDFNNQPIPHSLIFKNIKQIDFNGWVFKNIFVSYYLDSVIDGVSDSICIGNTIIIQNTISDPSLSEDTTFIKLLNGTFKLTEDWLYLKSLDTRDPNPPYNRTTHRTYGHYSSIKEELQDYASGGLGFNLYDRDFPLFFFNTKPHYFRIFFDRCDFITYQSGETDIIKADDGCTMYSDGYIAVQHSYNYTTNDYSTYTASPLKSVYVPNNICFVYCNILFYNNHGIPTWSTDERMRFLNSRIQLFGSADDNDMERYKINVSGSYVPKIKYAKLLDLQRDFHSVVFDFCNIDIIINLPRDVWFKNMRMFSPIYSSSLNINCPNTDEFMFMGENAGSASYSGVFTHAYPMKFCSEDESLTIARKIIDITDVRVEDYDKLSENPDYVLTDTNIPDDYYRLYSINDGEAIVSEYSYESLTNDFRYNKYVHNGLPFVPLSIFPKTEGWDINREVNLRMEDVIPTKIMHNNIDITSAWTESDDGIRWQKGYQPILQSQLYGNWFNNTEQWNNKRKTIETDYVFVDDESSVQYTVLAYNMVDKTIINPETHQETSVRVPEVLENFVVEEYQDNQWLPVESYKHEAENLTGIEVSSTNTDKQIWFEINKTTLNQFNWCIVISAMMDITASNQDNYLLYLPLTDISGNIHAYYIKQRTIQGVNSFTTNIGVATGNDDTVIPSNSDLYEGCHIFAINCYGILLELYVDGKIFATSLVTDYLKLDNPFKQNGEIGRCIVTEDPQVPGSATYDLSANFNGVIMGAHMFADYCSWSDIYTIYTSYGQKYFSKSTGPDFEPELITIVTANLPEKLEFMQDTEISYENLIVYAQFTDGTHEIHSEITYSIPEGTVISTPDVYTLTLTYDKAPEWSYSLPLEVLASYAIRITQLDGDKQPTSDVHDFDNVTQAKTFLDNNTNNLYDMVISNQCVFQNNTLTQYAFRNCSNLYSVTTPDNIIVIGNEAFYNCTNLTVVNIKNGVRTISGDAFAKTNIENITIPESVTTNVGFHNCTNLKSVIYNGTNEINGFLGCTALQTVTFTSPFESVGYIAFKGCTSLTSIDLSLCTTLIGVSAFENCSSLTTITLSNALKYVAKNAFTGTAYIQNFINSGNTYLINNNYLIYANNQVATNIVIPEGVTGIASGVIVVGTTVPNNCNVTLPTTLNYLSTQSFDLSTANTFINTLTIPSLKDAQSDDWFYNIFRNTEGNRIHNMIVGANVTAEQLVTSTENNPVFGLILADNITINGDNNYYKVIDNCVYNKSGTAMYKVFDRTATDVTIAEGTEYIMSASLDYCKALVNLYIPNSVTTIHNTFLNSQNLNVTVDKHYSELERAKSCFGGGTNIITYTYDICVMRIDYTTLRPISDYDSDYTVYSSYSNANTYINKADSTYRYALYYGKNVPGASMSFYNNQRLAKLIINCNTLTYAPTCTRCANLKEVYLPEGVINIGATSGSYFQDCTNLTTINIPSTVTSVHADSFKNSGLLTGQSGQVILDGWLIAYVLASGESIPANLTIDSTVKHIASGIFYNKSTIVSVNLNNVETLPDDGFKNCTNLTTVEFGSKLSTLYTASPSKYAFTGCLQLSTFTVPNDNPYFVVYNGFLYSKDYSTLLKIPQNMSNGNYTTHTSCTIVNGYAWDSSVSTDKVDINITFTNVVNLADNSLSGCKASINFPTTITNVGLNAFYNCTHLTNITLDNSITVLKSWIFYNCSALTSITLPNNLTEIGGSCFKNCTNLATINIPNTVTTFGGDAFFGTAWLANKQQENPLVIVNDQLIDATTCTGSVAIPNNITTIPSYCFKGCSATSITMNSNVTDIGSYAFQNCSALTSITLSTNLQTLGTRAFSGCTTITSIEIPGSVAVINAQTFEKCSSLTQLTLNEGLITINQLFTNSTTAGSAVAITTITIPSTVTSVNTYAFSATYTPTLQTIYINQKQSESSLKPSTWNNCTATIVWTS